MVGHFVGRRATFGCLSRPTSHRSPRTLLPALTPTWASYRREALTWTSEHGCDFHCGRGGCNRCPVDDLPPRTAGSRNRLSPAPPRRVMRLGTQASRRGHRGSEPVAAKSAPGWRWVSERRLSCGPRLQSLREPTNQIPVNHEAVCECVALMGITYEAGVTFTPLDSAGLFFARNHSLAPAGFSFECRILSGITPRRAALSSDQVRPVKHHVCP